jgi:hypothetical protein
MHNKRVSSIASATHPRNPWFTGTGGVAVHLAKRYFVTRDDVRCTEVVPPQSSRRGLRAANYCPCTKRPVARDGSTQSRFEVRADRQQRLGLLVIARPILPYLFSLRLSSWCYSIMWLDRTTLPDIPFLKAFFWSQSQRSAKPSENQLRLLAVLFTYRDSVKSRL